jgi:transposase InsO family protein
VYDSTPYRGLLYALLVNGSMSLFGARRKSGRCNSFIHSGPSHKLQMLLMRRASREEASVK